MCLSILDYILVYLTHLILMKSDRFWLNDRWNYHGHRKIVWKNKCSRHKKPKNIINSLYELLIAIFLCYCMTWCNVILIAKYICLFFWMSHFQINFVFYLPELLMNQNRNTRGKSQIYKQKEEPVKASHIIAALIKNFIIAKKKTRPKHQLYKYG